MLKNSFIADNTLDLTSLSLITISEFFTTLKVACTSIVDVGPNNTLYFAG